METLDYVSESITPVKMWPSWDVMQKTEFRVTFRLPWKISMLKVDQEYDVKYYDGDWYFKIPGIKMLILLNFCVPLLLDIAFLSKGFGLERTIVKALMHLILEALNIRG